MLTRRYPLTLEAGEGVWSAHRCAQVGTPSLRRNELFPAGLDLLVLQRLAKEPEQRPSDVSVVWSALEASPVEPWGLRESADGWSTLRPPQSIAVVATGPQALPEPKPI